MEYSKQLIFNFIKKYDRLHYILPFSHDSEHIKVTKKQYSTTAYYEKPIGYRIDLLEAIQQLSWRDRFVLLAAIYEGNDGCEIFSDWLDIPFETTKEIHELKEALKDPSVSIEDKELIQMTLEMINTRLDREKRPRMEALKKDVLNKLFRLMNPDLEHRGGARHGAGRKSKK